MIHRLSNDGVLPPAVRPALTVEGPRPAIGADEPVAARGTVSDIATDSSEAALRAESRPAIEAAIASLEPNFMAGRSRLSIDRDDQIGRFIYRSIDRTTGEVLGQWPADQVLNAMRHLREVEGLLVDAEA